MKAQDIMTSNPASVTPDTRLSDAAKLMKERDVGLLPVVEANGSGKLVGLITDRDITLRHVAVGHTGNDCTVREAMSENASTCGPDADIGDVMKLMGKEQVRRIPIVDERANLVGIVSQADIALRVDDAKRTDRTLEQISKP